MNSMSSYLVAIFAVMFWIFRIVVALTNTIGIDIGFMPMNITYEIILLFVTLIAIILVLRRNLIGGIIYLASYFLYFGQDLYNRIMDMTNNTATTASTPLGIFAAAIAIILSIAVLFDLILTKNRTSSGATKKTDWYYKNKNFDRKLDERADKNNYKF